MDLRIDGRTDQRTDGPSYSPLLEIRLKSFIWQPVATIICVCLLIYPLKVICQSFVIPIELSNTK